MKKFLLAISFAVLPVFAFAQGLSETGPDGESANVFTVLGVINNIINVIIPILIAAAVVYFIWGVLTYVISKDDALKGKGRDAMISSVIGLFVILSIWGIIALISNTFGVGNTSSLDSSEIDLVPTDFDNLESTSLE